MPGKRKVLEELKRAELLAALDQFGLTVADRRQRALLVDALGRSRKAALKEILLAMPRKRYLQDLETDEDLDESDPDHEIEGR